MDDMLTICEVGLRDGLQNESVTLTTAQKLQILDGLIEAGLTTLEVSSFVRPTVVPQMADSDAVMAAATARYPNRQQIEFYGLVFNERGYERALASGCQSIAIGLSVSETFSLHNIRMTRQQSMTAARYLITRAKRDGLRIRAYLSTAWVCPFEGITPPAATIAMAEEIWAEGIDELSVADTIGYAGPNDVGRLMKELGRRLDMSKLAVHLHDTQAMGLVNTAAAIHAGVRIVDSSIGGLGGCPFAPGAAGNLATEDLVFLAFKMGLGTGVDFPKLMAVSAEVEGMIGRKAGGRVKDWWACHRELI